jgi:hypothetical protein
MARSRRGITVAVGLAGLLLTPAVAWADRPDRATRRKDAEQRVARLEERLGDARVEGPPAEMWLELARRHVELAGKLLARNNERAAGVMVRRAERYLDTAEGNGAHQGNRKEREAEP